MDNKTIAAGVGLGALAALGIGLILRGKKDTTKDGECSAGYHLEDGVCVLDNVIVDDLDMSPSAIRERARQVYSEVNTSGSVIPKSGPPVNVVGFNLKHVYNPAILYVSKHDEWMARLESEDDAVIAEIAGDPYHIEIRENNVGTYAEVPEGTRIGQLRGHTWGSDLKVYEYRGIKDGVPNWVMIWAGSSSDFGGNVTYKLSEAEISLKSDVDWWVPPSLSTMNVATMKAGSSKYYNFNQSIYLTSSSYINRSNWLYLPAGVVVKIPMSLYAYGGKYTDYAAGQPMAFGDYIAKIQLGFGGCLMSYMESWYNPPTSETDYLTLAEQGLISGGMGDVVARGTIFSYSIAIPELTCEELKVWAETPGCGCGNPIVNGTPYGNRSIDNAYRKEWINLPFSVNKYGIQ